MGKKNVDETTVAQEAAVVLEPPAAPENPSPAGVPENPEIPDNPELAPPENEADLRDNPLANVEGSLFAVKAENGLNLRKGPHAQYGVIEVLPDGSLVSELALPYGAEVAGWTLVHTGLQVGWVSAQYLVHLEG